MTPAPDHLTHLLPKGQGTYALILRLESQQLIQVGRLGAFAFPAGHYLYVGSAFGPGGLAGRLGRHLASNHAVRRPHWHVDYLRHLASVVAIWYAEHETRREHDWATRAGRLAGASCPAPRFGASDCRCPAHLFHFHQAPPPGCFATMLSRAFPGDRPLEILQIPDRGGNSRGAL
jgi:Uri superfamily endonuclease